MESKLTGVDGVDRFLKNLHVRRSQEMEIEMILFLLSSFYKNALPWSISHKYLNLMGYDLSGNEAFA